MRIRTLDHWRAHRARQWARRMLRLGAVLLDTETTDLGGAICELAVVDARGRVLLETLIDPRIPIAPAAIAVHGIADIDLVDAPTLPQVLPRLLEITAGRPVLAYNAPYDRQALIADAARYGLDLKHLRRRNVWGCVMRARAAREQAQWRALEGGHRAAGDAVATAHVLRAIARP